MKNKFTICEKGMALILVCATSCVEPWDPVETVIDTLHVPVATGRITSTVLQEILTFSYTWFLRKHALNLCTSINWVQADITPIGKSVHSKPGKYFEGFWNQAPPLSLTQNLTTYIPTRKGASINAGYFKAPYFSAK